MGCLDGDNQIGPPKGGKHVLDEDFDRKPQRLPDDAERQQGAGRTCDV
jgi:hypothetical protein